MNESPIPLAAEQFQHLVYGFAITIVVFWLIFWAAVVILKTDLPYTIVKDGAFLQNITVIFIASAVVILSLGRILSGEIAGTILSGIAGYVLGAQKRKEEPSP